MTYKPEKLLIAREAWQTLRDIAISPLQRAIERYLEEKGVDYAVEGPKGWGWAQRIDPIKDKATIEFEDISLKMLKEVLLPELRKIAEEHNLKLDWDGDPQEDYYIVSISKEPFGGDKCLVKTITPEDSQT